MNALNSLTENLNSFLSVRNTPVGLLSFSPETKPNKKSSFTCATTGRRAIFCFTSGLKCDRFSSLPPGGKRYPVSPQTLPISKKKHSALRVTERHICVSLAMNSVPPWFQRNVEEKRKPSPGPQRPAGPQLARGKGEASRSAPGRTSPAPYSAQREPRRSPPPPDLRGPGTPPGAGGQPGH